MLSFSFIYAFLKDINLITDYQFALTSHVRPDSISHKYGNAIDIAPRNGPGYDLKLKGSNPNYNISSIFISKMKDVSQILKGRYPNLSQFIIEDDHIHLQFTDFPTSTFEFGSYATPQDAIAYKDGVIPDKRILATISLSSKV